MSTPYITKGRANSDLEWNGSANGRITLKKGKRRRGFSESAINCRTHVKGILFDKLHEGSEGKAANAA